MQTRGKRMKLREQDKNFKLEKDVLKIEKKNKTSRFFAFKIIILLNIVLIVVGVTSCSGIKNENTSETSSTADTSSENDTSSNENTDYYLLVTADKVHYEFDEDGNVISSSKGIYYKYDEQGDIVEVTQEDSDSGITQTIFEYKYDQYHNIINEIDYCNAEYYGYNDMEVEALVYEYEYDYPASTLKRNQWRISGLCTLGMLDVNVGIKGPNSGKVVAMGYDRATVSLKVNSNTYMYETMECSYDDEKKLIKLDDKEYEDDGSESIRREVFYEYEYDVNGGISRILEYRGSYDASPSEYLRSSSYEYDTDGNVRVTLLTGWWGDRDTYNYLYMKKSNYLATK
jgi:hypothetical protein